MEAKSYVAHVGVDTLQSGACIIQSYKLQLFCSVCKLDIKRWTSSIRCLFSPWSITLQGSKESDVRLTSTSAPASRAGMAVSASTASQSSSVTARQVAGISFQAKCNALHSRLLLSSECGCSCVCVCLCVCVCVHVYALLVDQCKTLTISQATKSHPTTYSPTF